MALHLGTLRIRLFSALFFVLIFLSLLWTNEWTFLLLFTLIHFGCWIEFTKIVALIDARCRSPFWYSGSMMLLGWGIILWSIQDKLRLWEIPVGLMGMALTVSLLLVLPVCHIVAYSQYWAYRLRMHLIGLCYVTLPCLLIVYGLFYENLTPDSPTNLVLITTMIFALWLNDTLAYFVGSLIGKTPFFPKISPKKTWEGALGGLLLTVSFTFVLTMYYFASWRYLLLGIVFLACFFGVAGDLIESKLKRKAQIKDSGLILPGHGGFLDRFDSMLLAVPAVVLWIFMYYFLV